MQEPPESKECKSGSLWKFAKHPWNPLEFGSATQELPRGGVSAPGIFFYHSPPMPVFAPTSPNILEYVLAVSKNLAHSLHPVHDNGKGGGWKWWE